MDTLNDNQLEALLQRANKPGFANRKLLTQLISHYRATLSYRDQMIYLLMAANEEAGFSFRNVNPDFQISPFFNRSNKKQESSKDSEDDDDEDDDDKKDDQIHVDKKVVNGQEEAEPMDDDDDDNDVDDVEDVKTKDSKTEDHQIGNQSNINKSAQSTSKNNKKMTNLSPLIVFLRQFNAERFKKSILAMPDDLCLDEITEQPDKNLYDVRFFLSAFFHLLNDPRTNCNEFVEQNCLAMVFSCLCMPNDGLRQSAYTILNVFRKHCTGNYGRMWQLLLDKLRCTMRDDSNKQFPAIFISCLIHLIPFIHKPTYAVYIRLVKFLTQSPTFKLDVVLEFVRDLLQSTDNLEPAILYQNAALIIMRKGIRTEQDCRLCSRVGLVDLLLNIFHSPLLTSTLRPSILAVFDRFVAIEPVARQLCVEKAFLLWINRLLLTNDKNLDTLDKLNQILIKLEGHDHRDFYPQFRLELNLTRNTCSRLIDQLL